MVTIPGAAQYTDISLLLLRVMLALVFGASGFNDLKSPKQRAVSIGMSVPFTIFLGTAEVAATFALGLGVLAQWAALGLIAVMLGAIYKKIFQWKTGFWGVKSMGWSYEMLLISMLLVIFTTGGGKLDLTR